MKKNLLVCLLCFAAILSPGLKSNAQGTLIHYWNFNNFDPGDLTTYYLPTIVSLGATYSIHDTAKARVTYVPLPGTSSSFVTYCDSYAPVASDSDTNMQFGDTAGNAFRARNPSDSMGLLFYIPSMNYGNLVLKYASKSSSTTSGMQHQIFSYSLDSGATWITSGSGLSEWTDSAWVSQFILMTIRITDPLASSNNKLVFRVTFMGQTTGTSGNNRFDNITLWGDSITSEAVNPVVIPAPTYSLYPNPVVNQLDVNASTEGGKSVTITNLLGQAEYTGNESGKHFSVNTSNFVPGMYYLSIQDNNSGNTTTLKFLKQ